MLIYVKQKKFQSFFFNEMPDIMHFGCKVNEIRHSNKGTGVEKLQCLTMHNKTLTNRNIKTKKKQKRWWLVWKSLLEGRWKRGNYAVFFMESTDFCC